MALNRPDTGQFTQNVAVNGLPMYHFGQHWRSLEVGGMLTVVRDKSNLHDANAIKVAYGNRQLGWVPKAVNSKMARHMDEGFPLYVQITRVGQDHLDIRVTSGMPAPPAPLKAPYPRVQLHRADGASLPRTQEGHVYKLRTASSRSSISLVDPLTGRDCYWFRKEELPAEIEAALVAGQLHLVQRSSEIVIEDSCYKSDLADYLKDNPEVVLSSDPSTGRTVTGRVFTTPEYQNFPTTTKGNNMSLSSKTTDFINANKSAATQAGYLEAGRIANNQVVKLSSKALPMMLRGYAETPIGKLLAANIAQMAAAQLRPNDPTLGRLTTAMTVAAYQEVIQTVDIEGWLDELMGSPAMKRAIEKLPAAEADEAADRR